MNISGLRICFKYNHARRREGGPLNNNKVIVADRYKYTNN